MILWQIENEYNYAGFSAEVKLHQLQALAHDSRDAGIDVPLITCMTNDPLFRTDPFLVKNVIECRNSYPKFDPESELRDITVLETYQPEKPRMITELQGGWFSEIGKQLSDQMGYTPEHITHVTLLAWAHGFTGTNYYMMFGGTNLGDWAAAGKTTTYDYAAPIRECGGVGARYFAVQAMANFLKEHGEQLARSSPVAGDMSLDSASISTVLRSARDGSRFLFIFNDQRNDHASGNLHVTMNATGGVEGDVHYDLNPFDARILYLPPGQTDPSKGRWFPEPVIPPRRPTNLPADVAIAEARRQVDPGPAADSWRDLPDGASIEDAGIFDRRYVFYRSSRFSTMRARMMLTAQLASQDSFIAQLNDARLDTQKYGNGTVAAVWPARSSDNNRLLILYENGGRDNGGDGIDARCGLRNLGVGNGAEQEKGKALDALALRWQVSGDTAGSLGRWQDPALDDSKWETVRLNPPSDAEPDPSANVPVNLVWYRLRIALPSPQAHVWVPWKLHLEAAGNGFLYLNGHALGRWWEIGPQKDFYLPECWLNFGPGSTNVVALCLRPTTGRPGVRSASVSPYRDFAETR